VKKENKYNNIDFITIPLRHIPFQSSFSILYTIFNALMPAYQTIALANFIDCAMDIFAGKRNSVEIVIPIIMIILYIIFINLMPSIASIINLTGKNKMTIVMKDVILNKRASLEYMHIENTETQELINRACSDPVGNFYSGFNNILTAANIIISSISLLFIIMTSTFISGILIILISIPLFIIAIRTGKRNYEMNKEANKIQRRYGYLSNILAGREYANERKLFDYSGSLQNDYNTLYKQSFKIEAKIEKKTYRNMKSGSIITLLIISVIISILLPSLNVGNITIGVFIALVNAVFSLVQTMSWQLSGTMSEHSRLQEYLKDLNSFFRLSEKDDACVMPSCANDFVFESIEFRNVCFKYPGTDIYVLNNCSFMLKNGKSYSFVGVNGAGKSTIAKLIIGLYDNYEGEILINGKDIQDYDYATIKAIISVLFQDFTTYAITLKDNIIMGNNMVFNEEKIKKITSNIGLDDFTHELKNDINTILGKIIEDGVDVSGGQWQRIAIARLLYSDAMINILDEPTASLDPVAESQVYKMFHRINNNRFTIYITHRLGAAKISDEILVVDGGKIVESGNHEQLMLIHDGLYHKMFDSQKSWYE
jgi:ATP-binding cassette subfamily B protein